MSVRSRDERLCWKLTIELLVCLCVEKSGYPGVILCHCLLALALVVEAWDRTTLGGGVAGKCVVVCILVVAGILVVDRLVVVSRLVVAGMLPVGLAVVWYKLVAVSKLAILAEDTLDVPD